MNIDEMLAALDRLGEGAPMVLVRTIANTLLLILCLEDTAALALLACLCRGYFKSHREEMLNAIALEAKRGG